MCTQTKLSENLPVIKSREEIISAILENKLIVIVRGVKGEALVNTAKALYAGGVRVMEITFDATGKTSESETSDMIAELVRILPDDMIIGSGTVIDVSKVNATRNGGGAFIISPDTNPEVIRHTRQLGMVSIPGAFTPSEACIAHNSGADFVKLFPIGSLGADYVKAIKAPLSHIKMLAVGGFGLDEIESYKSAGAAGFGVGSALIKKDLINAGEFEKLTELARKFVNAVK